MSGLGVIAGAHVPCNHGALSRQIVLHREEEVLACDCDMPSVHQLLSQIPQNLPYESLISQALQLFQRHPHTELAKQAALQHHKR